MFRRVRDSVEVALGDRRDRLTGAHTTRLPKGKLDPGETLEQAALREVAEETGLTARIVGPLDSVAYYYRQGDAQVAKRVHFFLMEAAEGAFGPRDGELERVYWCPIDRAALRLSFETERAVLERARRELEPA